MEDMISAVFDYEGHELESDDVYLWDSEIGDWDIVGCEMCCYEILGKMEGEHEIEEIIEYQEIVREKMETSNDFSIEYEE